MVVDDDITFLLMLKSFFAKKGLTVHTETTAEKGLATLEKDDFDLIISDFRMPGMDGMEFLQELRERGVLSHSKLVLLTSYGDIQLAVKAIKLGASDYLTKPVQPEQLSAIVTNLLQRKEAEKGQRHNLPAKEAAPKEERAKTYVSGSSPQTERVNEFVKLVGPTNMSVLIQGESGTGKEYVAREIHLHSKRAGLSFVAIDCGALSKDLAASELFGHIKGSFTGAVSDRPGQFEHAEGGTLFLDEIGNLSYETQVKLLRAIQEKVIRRVGGNEDIPVNVRLLAATNENLTDAIRDGSFREDLYHRLNEFKIEISPLRERPEEVEQFAQHFLKEANQELEREVADFDPETLELLKEYAWPGNLRELKNVVKRAVLLTLERRVKKKALPSEISSGALQSAEDLDNLQNSTDLKQLESALERKKIMEALEKVRYNKTKAARLLNIDRKTLYNKIRGYGLEA